jgi:hypothetical protein
MDFLFVIAAERERFIARFSRENAVTSLHEETVQLIPLSSVTVYEQGSIVQGCALRRRTDSPIKPNSPRIDLQVRKRN